MSHRAVRPSIERSANRPAPSPWQTSSGRPSHCRPARSRPASSRHQSSLKKVATALTASPVREGSTAARAGSRAAAWLPPRGSCQASNRDTGDPPASTSAPVSAIEQKPTDRTCTSPATRTRSREQPVDGDDGIRWVPLAPLRPRPLPGRGQRGPGDHAPGTVERHRLGHGGAEIDADVDGDGHVLRNLGRTGRRGQRAGRGDDCTDLRDFGSEPPSVYRSRSQDGLPRAAHAPLVRVAELADALA